LSVATVTGWGIVVVVVVATDGAVEIDAVIINASVKIVAASMIRLLFFLSLLRCIISLTVKHEYYG
jgi:hypothetical protein